MISLPPDDRMALALAEVDPSVALRDLARQLRDEGMCRADLLALYDRFRGLYAADADEVRYDAVLEAMDLIVGHCSLSRALYPDPEATA